MTEPIVADETTLRVAEVFASVQGESSFVGLPSAFIRLAGCNLRCRWCDTPEARQGGAVRLRHEVLSEALAFGTPLVALTGGEPLLQAGALPLLRELCDAGRTVLVETNGSLPLSEVDPRVVRIVDIKPPSSGVCDPIHLEQLASLEERDEVKFVLADRADYKWMRQLIAARRLQRLGPKLLASCVWDELDPRQLVEWVLADGLEVRVQVQLHKVIWGADAKGV